MENYIRIKECITMNQTAKDAVVLNYDDPVLREFGESRIEETEPCRGSSGYRNRSCGREDGLDGAEDLRKPDETAGEEPEQSETEVTETVSEERKKRIRKQFFRASGEGLLVFQPRASERGIFLDGDNIVYADGKKKSRSL